LAVDYTYAVARLRAMEAGMPDRSWFMRMARSPTRQLLTGVREHYEGFEGVGAIHEFESGIEADMESLSDFFSSVLGGGRADEFLRGGYDFDNYTLALKGKVLDAEPVLMPFGLTRPDVMETAVESSDPAMLPPHLKDLHYALSGAVEKGLPIVIERESEKAKWTFLLGSAPSAEAKRWVRLKIDRANIKSFARFSKTSIHDRTDTGVWIAGGTIEGSRYANLVAEPFEDFLSFLESTEWRGLRSRGFSGEMEAWRIDSSLDSTLLELIGGSKLRFFDIMPLLYHRELRERNGRILRTIFTGRINNLPEDDVADSVEALLS
jgi:vacuolar-type H+-ATPase subunit C/Vma6